MNIKKYIQEANLKSIAILSGGSLLAQAINFVGSIIVAKQYTDISIGQFTYIISIVAMFATVINGRYDVPIVSAKTEDELNSLVKLSFIITLVLSSLITIGSILFVSFAINEYTDTFVEVLFVFPLLIIVGLINILNAYNNRYAEYKLISSAYFIRTAFQNIIFLIAGFIYPCSLGLLTGQLGGQFFGVRKQSKRLIKDIQRIKSASKPQMLGVAKAHKEQLTFSVPATFINAVSYSILSLFVGNYFGMATLALYSYSVRVLGLPLAIFSSNISKVHFKEASEEVSRTNCFSKATKRMIVFSLVLAVLMVVVLMAFAPALFELIYGKDWRMAGVFVRYLAPMFALRMMVGAIGFTFIIADKQKVELVFQILLLIVFFVIYLIVSLFKLDMSMFVILLSITYSFVYFCELNTMYYYSKKVKNT